MREERFAACPLLMEASKAAGGRRILCDRPTECDTCKLFKEHTKESQIGWACFSCLDVADEVREKQGRLLGFYKSGVCYYCGHDAIALNAVLIPA